MIKFITFLLTAFVFTFYLNACTPGAEEVPTAIAQSPWTVTLQVPETPLSFDSQIILGAFVSGPDKVGSVSFYGNGTLFGAGTALSEKVYRFERSILSPGSYNILAIAKDQNGKELARSKIHVLIVLEKPV
jgi:hypothetical protein